jgi:hypothetical protein
VSRSTAAAAKKAEDCIIAWLKAWNRTPIRARVLAGSVATANPMRMRPV